MAKRTKPKSAKPAAKSPKKDSRKSNRKSPYDGDLAAERMLEVIDEDPCASSEVSRSVSITYYRALATMCRERAEQIQRERDGEADG